MYTYHPNLEIIALKEFEKLHSRLVTNKFLVETISFASIFWNCETIIRLEKNFFKYEQERKSLSDDISREVTKEIVDNLIKANLKKTSKECVILTKAGVLFPFIHISSILSGIETKVRATLAIPYPGTKEGHFLNYPSAVSQAYYRGEIF
ncbi:MAG: hypothetical protein A2V66_09605 [Ignavibacteria bacterium RBG_13_36_8]|nr:MAG: hypothetical protein A2V66_09605 [Ignavibacteria bacterium RBG_13_36_8]